MAATSGKKGKKLKAKTIPLNTFLANKDTPPGVTQVAKKVRNRGDESDEDDGPPQFLQLQLPTAPRASRMLDDDSVPQEPPFLAYISNLPFDVRDDDIYDFFRDVDIVSLRLPREDGENGRLRGFGYIELATRDNLFYALSMPDPHIKGRRVRIDVSNESEQQQRDRRGGNRSRYDGFGSSENRDSTNWRRGTDISRDDEGRRGGYGYNRDRQRDGSAENGNWRSGDRPNLDSSSPVRRGGGGGGGGFSDRFGGGRRGPSGYDDHRRSDDTLMERPKLNLKPRTLPLPEMAQKADSKNDDDVAEREPTPELIKSKSSSAAAQKVFGAAKPVDTAAREKEIEERLEKEQLEDERQEEKSDEAEVEEKENEEQTEKDEKENRNTISWRRRDDGYKSDENNKYSPDRRSGLRRNEFSDDRRGNVRDRRDFNRGFDRDNRMRDNRDRNDRSDRDYNRDRGFSKDTKSYPNETKQVREEKPKRDITRPEKPMPKLQPQQDSGPMLSTSNKYAVFQDEEEASE